MTFSKVMKDRMILMVAQVKIFFVAAKVMIISSVVPIGMRYTVDMAMMELMQMTEHMTS